MSFDATNPEPQNWWRMTWMLPEGDLVIVGQEHGSSYCEDAEMLTSARERGYIFGTWYSEICRDGEMGSNHESRCTPISQEEFDEILGVIQNA